MTLTRTMSAAAPQDKGSRTPKIFRRLEKDRKSTRLNSSHGYISYAVFCLKKKKKVKIVVELDEVIFAGEIERHKRREEVRFRDRDCIISSIIISRCFQRKIPGEIDYDQV